MRRKGYSYFNFGDRITPEVIETYQIQYLALTEPGHYSSLYQQLFLDTIAVWNQQLWIFGRKGR